MGRAPGLCWRAPSITPGPASGSVINVKPPERLSPDKSVFLKTQIICFPFDLFGNTGAGAGAILLADELREVLADNRREKVATRAKAYTDHVRLRQFSFATLDAYADWRREGRQAMARVLRAGDFLVWLSGNHLGVLPVYDELAGQDNVLVVQLDAHLDIHHFADCTPEPSHGNFLLHSDGRLPPLVNAGHRELLLTPDYIAGYYQATYAAVDLAIDPERALADLRLRAQRADRIYLDIDCDAFDAASFPAVGTPVPFGLAPALVLRIIDAIWSDKVRGVMLSEFDPARDRGDVSLATAMWLLEYLLLRRYEKP
jgi:agmatinase